MKCIDEIVGKWAEEGISVPQETIDYLIWYCGKKMDAAGIENREEYLPLLFEDELKNHYFRQYINAATISRMSGGCEECAVCV